MYKVALGAVLLLFIHMWVKEVLREEENNEKRKEGLLSIISTDGELKKQIDIIDDEIGYITLHIHTSLNNSKVSDAMEMAAGVRKCATFIEEKIGKHIDVTTMAYNRLMNHIRHMVSRAATGEKLKVDLNQFIEKNYPESFALAGDICKELGKDLNHEFLDNETGYLAIHIEQIKCDEMVSE